MTCVAPSPELGDEKALDLFAAGQYRRVVDLLLALSDGITEHWSLPDGHYDEPQNHPARSAGRVSCPALSNTTQEEVMFKQRCAHP